MAKSITISFKSGAVIKTPYSAKFYASIVDNIGKDHVAEHPSASVQTKDIEAVVYENIPDLVEESAADAPSVKPSKPAKNKKK